MNCYQMSYAGKFSSKGYDTIDPFKLIGGVAKDHPDEKDLAAAVEFYQNLITNGARDE